VREYEWRIASCDIGSLANLGWAIEGPSSKDSGTDIDSCIEALALAIKNGPMALGFEAPMFVPYGRKRCDSDKCRNGEGNRAFGASAGASVLAKGPSNRPVHTQWPPAAHGGALDRLLIGAGNYWSKTYCYSKHS